MLTLLALMLGILPQGAGAVSAAPLPPAAELVARLRGPGGRELARLLAHRGLPADLDWAGSAAALASAADPYTPPLVAAAALAPSWVSGHPPVAGAARRDAVRLAREALLLLPDDEDFALLALRILPWLQEEDLRRVAAFLHERREGNRRRALGLVATAPWPRARAVLIGLVRDPALAEEERAFLASRWFEAEGRTAMDAMPDLLRPGTPSLLLRRLLILARPLATAGDREWLRELAEKAAPAAGAAALELWARVEDRPEEREAIFRAALAREPGRRGRILDALAIAGPHEGIARSLVSLLRSPERAMRRLARGLLPRLAPPETVLAAWRGQPAAFRTEDVTGWMQTLARLPLAEARREALQWLLIGGGWAAPGAAEVASALRDERQVDALLPEFLWRDEVPTNVRLALALGRARESEAARDWLRSLLDTARGPRWERVVRALALAGDARDLRLLLDLARDPALGPMARAAAVSGLAATPDGLDGLLALAAEPPRDYEVLESLVRALVASVAAEGRRAGLLLAATGGGLEEKEYRDALQRVAWQEQEVHPLAGEAPALAAALIEGLRAAATPPGGASVGLAWGRELAQRHPVVDLCSRALRAALAAGSSEPSGDADRREARRRLEELDPRGLAPDALVLAAGLLARQAPAAARRWMQALLEEPELAEGARVRAIAIQARAASGSDAAGEAEALGRLLSRPALLVRNRRDLEYGLADPAARTWTLVVDRLAERRLVLLAAAAPAGQRRSILRPLAEGLATPSALLHGVALLLQGGGDEDRRLALALARCAAARGPGRDDVRQALAAAAGAGGG